MTPLLTAASDTATNPAALLALAALAGIAYVIHCAIWPFGSCRNCDGAGRFRSPSGRSWRYCNRCGGNGARLRTGRRIWTYLKHTHNRDHRTR
ncbi:hypothetical protein [uncultured Thermomonospora sp.]|uniref:hypothetical protein n=1 Tax=uncultured Thermomonospora sp. TaxID=671175 RepID=UPI00259BF1F2|nr:hypothetical protein [uncultured Thermomonospora sp.]